MGRLLGKSVYCYGKVFCQPHIVSWLLLALLWPCALAQAVVDATPAELVFYPDPGLRMDWASNCAPGMDATETIYLYFQDNRGGMAREMLATATAPTSTITPTQGCAQLLTNGDFETGTTAGWTAQSNHGATLVRTIRPHSGTASAFLGDADNASDLIYQEVSLPAGAGTAEVSYWWSFSARGTDTQAHDFLRVTARNPSGGLLATLFEISNATASSLSWHQQTHNLSAYRGQTIRLQFQVTTNASIASDFSIDDVSLIACAGSPAATFTPTNAPTPLVTATFAPTSLPGPTETPLPSLGWLKEDGFRIQDESAGVPYAVNLPDGRTRLYYCTNRGVLCSISENGLDFTEERNLGIGGCDVTMVTQEEGGYRMYYKTMTSPDVHVIHSATSSDGLEWRPEGLRLEIMGTPCNGWTSVPDAVRLPDGRVRLYFVCDKQDNNVASAISDDGLVFSLEEGTRLVQGVDPNVLRLADDTFLMFFATGFSGQSPVPPRRINVARSTDGLTWETFGEVLQGDGEPPLSADPCVVPLPGGLYRMYYGTNGGIRSAISVTTPTPTDTAIPPTVTNTLTDTPVPVTASPLPPSFTDTPTPPALTDTPTAQAPTDTPGLSTVTDTPSAPVSTYTPTVISATETPTTSPTATEQIPTTTSLPLTPTNTAEVTPSQATATSLATSSATAPPVTPLLTATATPTSLSCNGDMDGDGWITHRDFLMMMQRWQTRARP